MIKDQSFIKIKRNNIVNFFSLTDDPVLLRDVNKIITILKNIGIGQIINQDYFLTEDEFTQVKRIIDCWKLICDFELKGYRNNFDTKKLQITLIQSILTNGNLKLILILCPAYKKGKEEYGFKDSVGNTTIELINYLKKLTNELSTQIKISGEIWFSDLLIENYEKMDRKYVKKALSNNFEQIVKLISGERNMIAKRLSEVDDLKKSIGLEGKRERNDLPTIIGDRILNRSKTFYEEILGWDEAMAISRMEVLVDAYDKIGEAFLKEKNAIMVFGERNLERARMYSGDQAYEKTIPIIYPSI